MKRRTLLAGAMVVAAAPHAAWAQATYAMRVWRDQNCGCCHSWVEIMRRSGRFALEVTIDADVVATKQRLGVPMQLASCHTAVVEGYVIEGHVPGQDILRLLAQRPAGVRGLAVPGMPVGSPGMQVPGGQREAFDVVAFHTDGRMTVFARYSAS